MDERNESIVRFYTSVISNLQPIRKHLMTSDQKIQFILEHIPMQQQFNGTAFYTQNWGNESLEELKKLEDKMLAARLIKIDAQNGIYSLTILGQRVLANGGWVKFTKERAVNLQEQEAQNAAYEAMISSNSKEKETLATNNTSAASTQPPTASGGMKFSNVLFLIAFLLGIAYLIWRIWG